MTPPRSSRFGASATAAMGALVGLVLVITGCAPTSTPFAADEQSIATVSGVAETNILEIDGLRRSYLLRTPVRVDTDAPLPLLLVVHGAGGNGKKAEVATGMTGLSDADGFIVAYPNGTQAMNIAGELSWNAGVCCGKPVKKNIDDVAFIEAMIADIEKQQPVDRGKIFITGFSNGGMLAYRLACELPGTFAGVAVVAGAFNVKDCAGAAATSLLVIHGTGDLTVPHLGGATNERTAARFGQWQNVPLADSVSFWASLDGCVSAPYTRVDGLINHSTFDGCASEKSLAVVSIEGGGHIWPVEAKSGIDASSLITEFFGLSAPEAVLAQ